MKKNKLPYKKPGFTVPENYFEALEDRIMGAVTSDETDELVSAKRENPFKVPEYYFENVEERLLQNLEEERKPSKVIQLLNRSSFYYATATAAVFIALVATTFFNPVQPNSVEDIDVLALERYINENIKPSDMEIIEITKTGEMVQPTEEVEIEEEAIIEYLQENLEETAIIYNGN